MGRRTIIVRKKKRRTKTAHITDSSLMGSQTENKHLNVQSNSSMADVSFKDHTHWKKFGIRIIYTSTFAVQFDYT